MKIIKHRNLLKYKNLTKSQKLDVKIFAFIIPLFSVALYKIVKIKNSLKFRTTELLEIEKNINFLPKQPTDYALFNFKADPKLVDYFNQTLIQLKEKGECSAELLNKYNCASTADLETLLNDLLISGQSGNIEAQLQFQEMMNAYNNDFYIQASNIASEWYTNYSISQIPNISPDFIEIITNLDLFGIVCLSLSIGLTSASLIHFRMIHKQRIKESYENVPNEKKAIIARLKISKNNSLSRLK